MRDHEWRLLCGSHCVNTCEADSGWWPQKDTLWLVNRVPRNTHLEMCDFDCEHLLPGTHRHRVVMCNNWRNLPEQIVLRDPIVKGLIPLGCFLKIEEAAVRQRRARQVCRVASSD